MAIFSFFGKKDKQPDVEADKDPVRPKRDAADRPAPSRDAARATAMKIDAIESEMSSEMVRLSKTAKKPAPRPDHPPVDAPLAPIKKESLAPKTTSLPVLGMTTDFLLGSDAAVASLEVSGSETAPALEEAAILFANDQTEMVEQVLLSAIQEMHALDAPRTAWWMLFDLYQITGKQQQFDNLAIEYANKFETSPPTWESTHLGVEEIKKAPAGSVPMIAFSGKLDGTIIKQLERLQKLSLDNKVIRLEFVRVTEVDPIGCGLLSSVLKKLHKTGNDLVFVGASELAEKIRSILEVGRRDETEAPWLLLMAILELLNREKDFEDTSIDYCITFEVSPPAFVPPKNKVTTALEESDPVDDPLDHFMMPIVIDGQTDAIIAAIKAHASQHNPAIIDCSRLTRVDFSAAGQLVSGLAPLVGNARTIELHNVNHLVAALFNVMGLRDLARILPRKQ